MSAIAACGEWGKDDMVTAVKIANPIYDSVFKHLMENQEIARGLLSRLMGVDVLSLEPQMQEMSQRLASTVGSDERLVRVFRVDFAAEVRLADGRVQKALIELQKAQSGDVKGRFRQYLGEHYAIPAKVRPSLPIIAIYFLGFELSPGLPKVLKVKRNYLNGVTGESLPAGTRDEFVEMLTHDAVIVQIPLLDDHADTELERALAVFDQRNKDENNPHFLVMSEDQCNDPLVAKMLRTLLQAAADEDTRREMNMEDELEDVFRSKAKAEDAAHKAILEKEDANRREEEERRLKEEALKRIAELEAMLHRQHGGQ